jgi:DNA-binding XRE family transcriptional regulator
MERWRALQSPKPWSRENLAEALGVHRQLIYNFERRGHMPRPPLREQIVRKLDNWGVCAPQDWFVPAPAEAVTQDAA